MPIMFARTHAHETSYYAQSTVLKQFSERSLRNVLSQEAFRPTSFFSPTRRSEISAQISIFRPYMVLIASTSATALIPLSSIFPFDMKQMAFILCLLLGVFMLRPWSETREPSDRFWQI